jgi:hypothetical protein
MPADIAADQQAWPAETRPVRPTSNLAVPRRLSGREQEAPTVRSGEHSLDSPRLGTLETGPPASPVEEALWVEPYPGALLDAAGDRRHSARCETRQAIGLAFTSPRASGRC